MSWGEDVLLDRPADARLARLGCADLFDPWAEEEVLRCEAHNDLVDDAAEAVNDRDCDVVEHLWSFNPPLDEWSMAWAESRISNSVCPPPPPSEPRPPDFWEPPSGGLARPGGPRVTEARGSGRDRGDPREWSPFTSMAEQVVGVKDVRLRGALQRAGRLGLLCSDEQRPGESTTAWHLRLGVRQRARETYDAGRLETALKWFEEFLDDTRILTPFVTPEHAGDVRAMVHNQETLDSFAEYVRRRGSRLTSRWGDTIRADSIAAYVGQIKKLRTHEAHVAVTDKSVNVVAPAAFKRMRQEDAPSGGRKLCLGMRARLISQVAILGFDRRSVRGAIRWGAALTAHNLLCRGGEVCVRDGHELDVERDLVIGSIVFKEPGEVSDWMPWLTAAFAAIKDVSARRQVSVMPVRRRSSGGQLGDDPMDVYDAIVLALKARLGRMPPTRGAVEGPEADLPLFTGHNGRPWRTTDSRLLAREFAERLRLNPEDFGAKSFRIGGATDYRAAFGAVQAERLIRQRGRWWSDIHQLYERALAEEHLTASAAVGSARGAELEALCEGWAQPAEFR